MDLFAVFLMLETLVGAVFVDALLPLAGSTAEAVVALLSLAAFAEDVDRIRPKHDLKIKLP